MTKPIIELKKVWKTYKMGDTNVHALQGIDLAVYPGEFLAAWGSCRYDTTTTSHWCLKEIFGIRWEWTGPYPVWTSTWRNSWTF